MPAETLKEQIVKYLTDVHSLEANAIDQLRTGAESAEDPALAEALRSHLVETEDHERLVRGRLESLGASPAALKDLAQRAGAMVTGLMANAAPDTTGKLAINAYTFEHLELASYRSLRAVAEQAEDAETVALADRIIPQEQSAADALSAILERVALVSVPQTG